MSCILVVDDQPQLLRGIAMTLESVGYDVLTAGDGVEALEVLRSNSVDLILADIAMPRMNGYQLYERIRQNTEWLTIPFVFLTARTLDSDIRYGKELGVDDYLTKPIEVEDLLATIQGKMRRSQQLAQLAKEKNQCPGVLCVGTLCVDTDRHEAYLGNERLDLSAREFALLVFLARKSANVVSPTELVHATHGIQSDRIEAGALLRPLVRTLRRKMGFKVGETGCIENIRGVGYRLIPPHD